MGDKARSVRTEREELAHWKERLTAKPRRRRSKLQAAHLCHHANEAPMACPCSDGCYCKTRTCKRVRASHQGRVK
jgi:hypothetical protein